MILVFEQDHATTEKPTAHHEHASTGARDIIRKWYIDRGLYTEKSRWAVPHHILNHFLHYDLSRTRAPVEQFATKSYSAAEVGASADSFRNAGQIHKVSATVIRPSIAVTPIATSAPNHSASIPV